MSSRPSGLSVSLGKIVLANPLVLASGILGVTASCMARVASMGAGAVTTKSCSVEPRTGHKSPCILPVDGGLLNAVGLSNPGVDAAADEIRAFRALSQTPIFASVFARSVEEFGEVTRRIATARPDLIEVNVSCPNVQSEFGTPFGADFDTTARITRSVKDNAGDIPVALKLTIHCPSVGYMAKICQDNGADVITAINTVGPGMAIDVATRHPVLSNKMGGLSGPAIFPLALKAVWEVSRNCTLPIIATGGVSTGNQAAQMILAGATAVAIGTGVYDRGLDVFEFVARELTEWVDSTPEKSLSSLRGAAHG